MGDSVDKPIPEWKRQLAITIGRIHTRYFIFSGGYWWIDADYLDDYDYTKYLGPNYEKSDKICTFVANHQAWTDIIVFLTTDQFPSFVSKDSVKKVPFIGRIAILIQTLFIDRNADKGAKQQM